MNKIEKAVQFALQIANDPSHGYDQINRWGPNYDCSSLLITAYEQAGIPVKTNGATYTGDMRTAFKKCGFRTLIYAKGMKLLRGDILLNEKHHTAMYLGDGQIVQASINEKGTATGGRSGDQTGREIYIGRFYEYKYGWEYILRYEEQEEVLTVNIEMRRLTNGSKCAEVSLVQTLLNAKGFKGKNGKSLTVDGDFGSNTENAVKLYQRSIAVTQDGIVGDLTWNALLHAHY